MHWKEVKEKFPNEWVAFSDYAKENGLVTEGIVVAHHPDRQTFHRTVGHLLPQYGDLSIRYTGPAIQNEETPLLWQISHTESING